MKTKILGRIIATVLAVPCLLLTTEAQTLNWANHYATNGFYDGAYDVHVGGDGRIYVSGYSGTSANTYGALLASYSANGTQNWATNYTGGDGTDNEYNALTTFGSTSSIAIYAAGKVSTSNGGDMLLSKYNQSGGHEWSVTWNILNFSQDIANAVTVDGSGNIYVCGKTSINGGDLFVAKYNSLGLKQWGITYNSINTQNDEPQFMKINSAGTALYITSIRTITSSDRNAVLQKIDAGTGTIIWTSVWDGTLSSDIDETYSLDIDAAENIYTAGKTQSSSNGADGLLLKYNSSGTLQCAKTWNNASYNLDDVFGSIDVYDLFGTPNVYVAGYTVKDIASNDADYLTVKYDGSNCLTKNYIWVSTYDGRGNGCPEGNDDIAYMIMVSPTTGYIYVTGRSFEFPTGLDATTVSYEPSTGAQQWAHSYDRGVVDNYCSRKYPLDIFSSGCTDDIYITGYTVEGGYGSPTDATTLKYSYAAGDCRTPNPDELSSIEESGIESLLYPNPFSNTAILKCSKEDIINATFTVYDVTGREVKRFDNINTNQVEIEGATLNEGIYFYQFLQAGELITSGKFVIRK